MPSKEILSPSFAVFNNHINDADRKARFLMMKFAPKYLEQLEANEKKSGGVMGIFQEGAKASQAVSMYITFVTAFVNEETLSELFSQPVEEQPQEPSTQDELPEPMAFLTLFEASKICTRLELDASWDKCGSGYYTLKSQVKRAEEREEAEHGNLEEALAALKDASPSDLMRALGRGSSRGGLRRHDACHPTHDP